MTTRKNNDVDEEDDSDEFKDALSDEEAIKELVKSEQKLKESPETKIE